MFVRIDRDLSVNINNIFSYKISEDLDSYKLQLWSNTGSIIHTIIYLKSRQDQLDILISFNNTMRELMVNPDRLPEMEYITEEETHAEPELKEGN